MSVGVANEKQSALGTLTANLLKELDLYDAVRKNVSVDTPTADLLVNQLLGGSAACFSEASVPVSTVVPTVGAGSSLK